jgi:opacity protein-like surface antigen
MNLLKLCKKISQIKKAAAISTIAVAFCFSAVAKQPKSRAKKRPLPKTNVSKEQNQDQNKTPESAPAISISGNKHGVGVGLGQTFLGGDFSKNGEDQITVDLLYIYKASYSFDFLADFHYSKHTFRGNQVKLKGLALGIKGKVFHFDAFSPFVLGGFGFYEPQTTRSVDGVLTESESKITFGYHVGGGADLELNKNVTIGILGHIHNPFDIKQEVGAEVSGSYFKLLLTAIYSF